MQGRWAFSKLNFTGAFESIAAKTLQLARDNPGKKVVFVSHCLLNQNARALGREKYAGAIKDVMDIFTEAGVGIIQIPCPQVEFNGGLHRRSSSMSPSSSISSYPVTIAFRLAKTVCPVVVRYTWTNINTIKSHEPM